jgi:uncharacterized protein YwqG/predicted DNA-binding WGR domain protein
MKTYLKFQNEKTGTVWEIEVQGKYITQNLGKIGERMQTGSEEEFSSIEEALREAERLIAEKLEEGYQKVAESDEVVEDIAAKAESIIAQLKMALRKDALPYIGFQMRKIRDENLKPWQSNIGFRAYWTLEMEIPKDKEDKEMLFFGQINLEELPKLPGYPEKGLLLFFLPKHYSSFEKESRVIYVENIISDISKLNDSSQLTCVTTGTYQIVSAPEIKLSYAYPPDRGFDPIMRQYEVNEKKVMELVKEEITEWKQENTGHRMGGYAFFAQEDPRRDKDYQDYLNLFQIDELDDEIMLWGDSGIAHFLIHPNDLAQRDFSRVLFVWDCY